MYDSADEVVAAYVGAGYFPLFVTGRPMYVDERTRDWLDLMIGVEAPLFLTEGFGTTVLDVEDYKADLLTDLTHRVGLNIQFAYGNATTDVCAYARTGIDPSDTFIIGKHAGAACEGFAPTVAVSDYPTHLGALEVPPAAR